MNYLKYTYEELQSQGYFEDNVNIILTQAPKKHRRIIEEFLCCADNSKFFVRGYLKLKDELKKDRSLAKSIVMSYKDLLYDNMCSDRNSIKLDAIRFINILLLALFIDDKGVFKIGNTHSESVVFKAIRFLTNEKYDIKRTIREVKKILQIDIEEVNDKKSIYTLTDLLFPYTINLLEPAIYRNKLSDELYLSSVVQMVKSAKLEGIKGKIGHNIAAVLLFSNISTRNLDLVEKCAEELKITPYRRTGFLKPEYAVGTLNAKDSKIFNNKAHVEISYYVNEIIHKDGVLIKFQILTKDFMIFAIDDYIKNIQILHIMFYDSSTDNSEKSMQETAFMFYYAVRDEYAKKINEEKYTIPSVDLNEEDGDEEDSKYTKKLIQIAPYVRFLPKGQKRSEGKVEEAAKFNMVLEDDETFVNVFDKHCRVLKETAKDKTDDIRFETKYN